MNNNSDYSEFDITAALSDIYDTKPIDDSPDTLLEGLNPEQRQAVKHLDGPLLILAGAGSGKTRVITYRIAYMMKKHNVSPGSILAITFTNKAAKEMQDRIRALVGDRARYIWCGTFHSIFARILRRHADLIGYSSTFSIVDTDDQLKLIKRAMAECELSEKLYKPKDFLFEISKAKNIMVDIKTYTSLNGADKRGSVVGMVYSKYQELLASNNSMDFDDILINTVRLLDNNPDVLSYYHERFTYIMVDEYQDTNLPQYRAVRLLADKLRNVCVVGDDDQSIYSFRGADVRMILNFEKDFKNTKVIKLEENYRSTRTILDAANEVISHNTDRKTKSLRTKGEQGEKIIVMNTDTQAAEASFVSDTIQMMVSKNKFKYSDIAILYRMNALSRSVEMTLRDKQIPYRVYGGMRFYDRKEIKDVFAYLRLIADSHDNLAFDRIINVPRRGIGDTTVNAIHNIAIENDMDFLSVCANCRNFPELGRVEGKLMAFSALIQSFRDLLSEDRMSFAEFIDYVEDKSGIIDEIIAQRESKGELIDRVENLKELLSEAVEFEKNHRLVANNVESNGENNSENNGEKRDIEQKKDTSELDKLIELDPLLSEETRTVESLAGVLTLYLQNAALYSQGDEADESEDYVKMMSIHSSKGLEFGAVFIIGLEETLFPSYKAMSSSKDLEEERRLMYVAITRAKKNLFIVLTQRRMLFGQTQCNAPSRFLLEINPEHLYKMGTARKPDRVQEADTSPSQREKVRKQISSALSSNFIKRSSESKTSQSSDEHSGLRPGELVVGMKVKHPRFGEGTILKTELVAGDALVSIDFDGMRKNMLAKSAGLTKV